MRSTFLARLRWTGHDENMSSMGTEQLSFQGREVLLSFILQRFSKQKGCEARLRLDI